MATRLASPSAMDRLHGLWRAAVQEVSGVVSAFPPAAPARDCCCEAPAGNSHLIQSLAAYAATCPRLIFLTGKALLHVRGAARVTPPKRA